VTFASRSGGRRNLAIFQSKKKINLALQGGGAHGAFTWGVLDRLLQEPRLEFGWISAASAGSVNAVAVAAGLASGGQYAARDVLKSVWERVLRAGVPDLLRWNPFLASLSTSTSMAKVASMWSPYDFNPLGFDPLRQLLEQTIDFEAIRTKSPVELLIAATEVQTGRSRLFRRNELTVESVLASACLPTLHHAVVIDGVSYWDGGFSANPDLVTLAMESPISDSLIVQISPLAKMGVPTGVRDIQAYTNRLTFNAPLVRDAEVIETAREAMRGLVRSRINRLRPLAMHRFHLIEAGAFTADLADETRMKPELSTLSHLFEAGLTVTDQWLKENWKSIGRKETVDLRAHFGAARAIEAANAADVMPANETDEPTGEPLAEDLAQPSEKQS
jgi:NTE family protein